MNIEWRLIKKKGNLNAKISTESVFTYIIYSNKKVKRSFLPLSCAVWSGYISSLLALCSVQTSFLFMVSGSAVKYSNILYNLKKNLFFFFTLKSQYSYSLRIVESPVLSKLVLYFVAQLVNIYIHLVQKLKEKFVNFLHLVF